MSSTVQIQVNDTVVSRRRPKRRGIVTALHSAPYERWLILVAHIKRENERARSLYAAGFFTNLELALQEIPDAPSKEPTHARVRWASYPRFGGGIGWCSATVRVTELRHAEKALIESSKESRTFSED